MSARTDLRDALREDIDTGRFLVPDDPKMPDTASAKYRWAVTVEQSSVKPGPTMGTLSHELHLMLAVLTEYNAAAETELEEALEVLLEQLITADRDYGFVSADRDVIGTFHAYDITLTISSDVTKE